YAWQHERFWLAPTLGDGDRTGHPLLGVDVDLPDHSGQLRTGELTTTRQPWLVDHGVHGTTLPPGTACGELALRAAGGDAIEELNLQAPLVIPERGAVRLRVVTGTPDEAGR